MSIRQDLVRAYSGEEGRDQSKNGARNWLLLPTEPADDWYMMLDSRETPACKQS